MVGGEGVNSYPSLFTKDHGHPTKVDFPLLLLHTRKVNHHGYHPFLHNNQPLAVATDNIMDYLVTVPLAL